VCELGTGSAFGEETVFRPGPRSATVEAVTDVSVRLVTREMLDEGLGRDSWFGAFVMALANRLAQAEARPATVSQPDSKPSTGQEARMDGTGLSNGSGLPAAS
jgi:CRP-like cAMP-binding protein